MSKKLWQIVGVLCVLLAASIAGIAAPVVMDDSQLDQVFAAGFDIHIDLSMNIDASKPDSVIMTGGDAQAVQDLLNAGMNSASRSAAGRNSVTFDPSGASMPNLQNLTVNNINIADSALQNATTLMNIFALEGDVAVGVNLNVIVNPINTNLNVWQSNVNWGTLNLSDTFSTIPGQ